MTNNRWRFRCAEREFAADNRVTRAGMRPEEPMVHDQLSLPNQALVLAIDQKTSNMGSAGGLANGRPSEDFDSVR
jgi:hypothetical protein